MSLNCQSLTLSTKAGKNCGWLEHSRCVLPDLANNIILGDQSEASHPFSVWILNGFYISMTIVEDTCGSPQTVSIVMKEGSTKGTNSAYSFIMNKYYDPSV